MTSTIDPAVTSVASLRARPFPGLTAGLCGASTTRRSPLAARASSSLEKRSASRRTRPRHQSAGPRDAAPIGPKEVLFVLLVIGIAGLGAACRSDETPAAVRDWPVPDLELAWAAAPLDGLVGVVEQVVDGDTIRVGIDGHTETVRLLGIDTPEKAGGPRPAECFGAEASQFAEQLLPAGTAVSLSRDHESRDQYGRLLAFVHRADGLLINQAMLELGYATPLFFAPNTTMSEAFTDAANLARREWRGFWPACGAANVVIAAETPR